MAFKVGFWIGYGIALVIQVMIWSGIVYLLFNSLNQQIKRSPYEKILKILFVPMILFIVRMSHEFFYLPWNSSQFIWGSCIILLFTIADLFVKIRQRQKSLMWWEELGNFDYVLIGILAGSTLYASALMFISFHTGLGIILVMFPTAWFVFLGCLQTRNEHYLQNDGSNSAKREKESRRFLSFFYKLMTVFSCLVTLAVQFMQPLGLGLLLFDMIVLAIAVIVPLYAKLNKKINHAGAGYSLLFLASVAMNFIYSNEALLVLRAIGGYVGALPDLP
ncbi:MAG: hypothetical protein KHX55_01675 [Proteobacteria bacterium]|nr:hypothetical protein [Pseudomonadota bacterium]